MARPKKGEPVQRDVIFSLLPAAIAHSSGNGQYEFNQRGLFYAVRPGFIEVFGKEPLYSTFTDIITDYEAEVGDVDGMYRDDRGALYVPHSSGEPIALGQRLVRAYERPEWTFNKILYVEKGSFVSLLRQAGWPELHDCAILTSQGYASRAVRDLFDALGETDEDLTFFCVHDADGYGTCIYQTLVQETKARPGRKVEVINLGLDPEEALAMRLPVEPVDQARRIPAADYLSEKWREWLQTKRVELNAMTSPQFIQWLDSKMAEHDRGKVIPPEEVLEDELEGVVSAFVRERAEREVRVRTDFDRLLRETIAQRMGTIDLSASRIEEYVAEYLNDEPSHRWDHAVGMAAEIIMEGQPLFGGEV
jgi:hypothetical protein